MNKFKFNFYLAAKVISLFLVFSAPSLSNAQATTLALGDIAITGYNSSPATFSDEFSFVILKSTGINSGTTIYFTDRNWKGGSCGTDNFCTTSDNALYPEGSTITHFVWTSGSSLSYGTHVKITGGGSVSSFTCSNGSASGNCLVFPTSGDQVFALQNGAGSTTTSNGASGTMLTGFTTNKSILSGCSFSLANWDDCTSNISSDVCGNSNQTNKPACLTNGTNCMVMLDGSQAEVANGVYNCTSALSGTSVAAINAQRTAICTYTNWTTSSSAVTIPPSGCSPLPVSWSYFNAGRADFGVNLEWGTASERNCSHFEIYRSFDLVDWKKIHTVSGQGTKASHTTYFYDDYEMRDINSIAYYRLKQVDFDGRYEYTPIRSAEAYLKSGYTAFDFNGNPYSQSSTLRTFLPNNGEARIEILDASGNVVFDQVYQYGGGFNRFNPYTQAPDVMNKPGFYFLRASIENETKTFKLVVQ